MKFRFEITDKKEGGESDKKMPESGLRKRIFVVKKRSKVLLCKMQAARSRRKAKSRTKRGRVPAVRKNVYAEKTGSAVLQR